MKNIIIVTIAISLLCSCAKWNTPEKLQKEHIGGFATLNNDKSDAYYASLREYRKQYINYGRPVAFGWFSNWSPSGTIRKGYLSAVPDSMDIISMWSGAPNRYQITEEQRRDKEFVQKVKGIKLLEVNLLSHLGKGRTPDIAYKGLDEKSKVENWSIEKKNLEYKHARWDFWGFTSHDLGNKAELEQALSKYARALCDSLYTSEWDGFDIDWEPAAGFNDSDGTLNNETILYLIKEMGKYIGPKSDPENKGHKLLCIDGEISGLESVDEYVDYWIKQTYGRSYPSFYDVVNPRKAIITENFESNFADGGVLLDQAKFMPQDNYKGGVGAYRFDNDYNNKPDYRWMRKAIQLNQQVFLEWKKKNKNQ